MQNADYKIVEEGCSQWCAYSWRCFSKVATASLLVQSIALGILAIVACQPILASLDDGDGESIDIEYSRFVNELRDTIAIAVDSDMADAIENTPVELRRCDDISLESERKKESDMHRRVSLDHGIDVHIPRAYLPERHIDRTGVTIGFQPLGTRAFATISFAHIAINSIQELAESYGGRVQVVLTEYFENHNVYDVISTIYTSTRQSVDAMGELDGRFIAECLLTAKVVVLPRGAENGLYRCTMGGRQWLIPSPNETGSMGPVITAHVYIQEVDKLVGIHISNVSRPADEQIELDALIRLLESLRFSVRGEPGDSEATDK